MDSWACIEDLVFFFPLYATNAIWENPEKLEPLCNILVATWVPATQSYSLECNHMCSSYWVYLFGHIFKDSFIITVHVYPADAEREILNHQGMENCVKLFVHSTLGGKKGRGEKA